MNDYISREAAIEDFEQCNRENPVWTPQRVKTLLMRIPAADVEPVRHGEWIEDHDYLKCPECGVMVMRDFTFFDIGDWNYCPSCGAKMDLEADHEN